MWFFYIKMIESKIIFTINRLATGKMTPMSMTQGPRLACYSQRLHCLFTYAVTPFPPLIERIFNVSHDSMTNELPFSCDRTKQLLEAAVKSTRRR